MQNQNQRIFWHNPNLWNSKVLGHRKSQWFHRNFTRVTRCWRESRAHKDTKVLETKDLRRTCRNLASVTRCWSKFSPQNPQHLYNVLKKSKIQETQHSTRYPVSYPCEPAKTVVRMHFYYQKVTNVTKMQANFAGVSAIGLLPYADARKVQELRKLYPNKG